MFNFPKRQNTKKNLYAIFLRGAQSTGKTTTAFILRERLSNTMVLSLDWIMMLGIPKEILKDGKKWKEVWLENRPFGRKMIRAILEVLIKENKNVVIEEVLPDLGFMKEIVAIVKKLGAQTFVFELTAPFDVLLDRERNRDKKDPERLLREVYDLLEKYPYPGAIRIDTSKKSQLEVADLILNKIKSTEVF